MMFISIKLKLLSDTNIVKTGKFMGESALCLCFLKICNFILYWKNKQNFIGPKQVLYK